MVALSPPEATNFILCGMAALPEKVTESAETDPFPPSAIVLDCEVMVPVSDVMAIETFELSPEVLVTVLP